MITIKQKNLLFTLFTTIMIVTLGISFFIFNSSLNAHMHSDVDARLQESVEPNIVSFNLQMHEQIKKVNTFASFLGNNWELGKDVHTTLLQAAVDNNDLLRCALAYPDGSFITHDNKNDGDVSQDAFFLANMNGEFFITDPRPAVVDPSKRVILFAAPVINKSNEIVGSIIYSYLCNDMDEIFNLKSMGGEMNMVITKQDGSLLIGDSEFIDTKENLFNNLRIKCTHKDHLLDNCLVLSEDKGVYSLTFEHKKEKLFIRYDKLEFNDWYMVATIPEKAATNSISFAADNQRTLISLVGIIIILYLSSILLIWFLQRKLIDSDTGALTIYGFKRNAKKIFKNRKHSSFVVVKLDVKDFKLINRIHSFSMGDKLIVNIARALKFVSDDGESIFARVGVDVFLLLFPYKGADSLKAKRQAFINHFQTLMEESFSTRIIFPTGQYVLQPSDYPKLDIDEILEKVNFAHRAAKHNGDVIIDYEVDIESAALFEKNIEDRMESAIKNEEFTLYLQPKIKLKNEKLCGAEALVRWKIGEKYYMYPTDFIPVLEKNGFIVQLDKYMFQCSAIFVKQCLDKGIEPIPISVNFSRLHLNNNNFVGELCSIADKYNIPRKYLEIELTESAFVSQTTDMIALIDRLHHEGFLISMDDFGSGYSCFAQLKDIKIDVLKIDKGFFNQSEDEKRAEVVIAGILKIAQELNITTVAEGVEHKHQVETLRSLGCDIIQGYYYSKPIPATQLDVANYKVTPSSKK